ncbi:MAG: prephenate dehydrogenase/arogenate dehydrogenase family protein [Chloroflexi bacterium]|nr:prephenate dehydrogenase/arogenate dehydrogenase family protein [Chloroflexota bacterium]
MDKTVITIVGLGQIGTSIGLALEKHGERLERIGHTRQNGQANHAKKIGAVDKTVLNLPSSVRKADIVILALPVDQVQDVVELIAPDLKEGVVVLDTSPAREAISEWMLDKLPAGRFYIGFTPVLNPRMLETARGGIREADALLFQDGMFAITSPINTSNHALKVASDLAMMLDALPLFADMVEVDSYISKVHVLPLLLAASLANVTIGTPGWHEGRKMSGRAYAQLTNLLSSMDPAGAIALAAQLNKDHVLRSLDAVIEELQGMRDELAADANEALMNRVEQASEGRRRWWQERQQVEWVTEAGGNMDFSNVGNSFGQLFGYGNPPPKRKR